MKKPILLFTAIVMSAIANAASLKVDYNLSFEESQGHYVDVEMTISKNSKEELDVKMPVWAPGSYLVREFARNVEGFSARTENNTLLNFSKTNKNTWTIKTNKASTIIVKYRVYAFELTVRTSFVDDSHAYLNGTSIFMYVDGFKNASSEIKIKPNNNWSKISCSLPIKSGNVFHLFAENYDILGDSPIEIGNQEIIEFNAAGVEHQVAMVGVGNYDKEKIKKDFSKIVEEETKIFAKHPCKSYVFIVHNVNSGGGGLEHLNSTTVQVQRNAYSTESTYNSFLSLIAHEYFHLWNVKRLRPVALGPFDYDNENYTRMLWVAEGFTAFYDNWMIRRSGFHTHEKYLEVIANEISALTNLQGAKVQSLSESSYDAWIKYYRRNENSNNSQVSYYDKGSVVANMLNLLILQHSAGKENLDNLMKHLYTEYYENKGRGYTDEEFKLAAEKYTGINLTDFYAQYIDGTKPINFEEVFKVAGIKLTDLNASKTDVYFGVTSTNTNGKVVVTAVAYSSSAYKGGINVNDEILAIDNFRTDDISKALANKKVADVINVLVNRDGMIKTLSVKLEKSNQVKYKLEKVEKPTAEQEAIYKGWLY